MTNNYALITGGSSGIGYEIAKNLAGRGYNILLISRNEKNLQDCCHKLADEFNKNFVQFADNANDEILSSAPKSVVIS